MTLLELMLVLALLVIMGALVLPALRGPFKKQRLRKAGEVVRVEWNKARIKAMKTGQIQMFRYDVEDSSYSVEPYFTEQDMLEGDALHGGEMAAGTGTGAGTAGGSAMGLAQQQLQQAQQQQQMTDDKPRQLPEGVIFASGETQTSLRDLQVQQQMSGNQLDNIQVLLACCFILMERLPTHVSH